MEKLKVNNIDLAYTRQGTGKPLLLLHGYPLDHHIWDKVTPLLENTFDLILPDLRGFGESNTVDTPYTLDDFVSDLIGLLNHLGIEKTAVVGHSMGGYTALAFARLHPQRLTGLGMVSSQALADPPERKEGRYKTAQDVSDKGIQWVVDTMTTKLSPNAEIQKWARESMGGQQPAAYIGALKAMAERQDASALLSTFKFPVVIIHGDADELIPVDRAREMKSAVPQAQLIELKGAGHLPMLEEPEATAKALMSLG